MFIFIMKSSDQEPDTLVASLHTLIGVGSMMSMSGGRSRRSSSLSTFAKDQPEKMYNDLKDSMIRSLQELSTDEDLCDVTFLVGLDGEDEFRQEIKANSTILSLRSPYFRAMCFGPLRKPGSTKRISDLRPDIFQKVLAFIHCQEGCLRIDSMEEAWTLRYAASQFLMADLVRLCENYLEAHLTYRNGLKLLEQASAYKAEEFKKKIYKVIKNRHIHVLQSPEMARLDLEDLINLLRLYRSVPADLVIDAIRRWGEDIPEVEFKEIYKTKLFQHIQWSMLTNKSILKVHSEGILPLELEIEAMVAILSRSGPLPSVDSKAVCTVDLELTRAPCQRVHSIYSPCSCSGGCVSRVILQTIRRSRSFFQSKSGTGPIVIYHEGIRMLQDVLKNKHLKGVLVDTDDIDVSYSFNYNAKMSVNDLRAQVFGIRVENQDIFYFILNFAPIDLDRNSNPGVLKGPDKLSLVTSISPELLKDLSDDNLLKTETLIDLPSLETTSYPFQITTKTWATVMNEEVVLNNEMKDQQKYFFIHEHVPIYCQIN